MNNLTDPTPAQRAAYEDGQNDFYADTVDDLRAMRCDYYLAGVRAAHYADSCQ